LSYQRVSIHSQNYGTTLRLTVFDASHTFMNWVGISALERIVRSRIVTFGGKAEPPID